MHIVEDELATVDNATAYHVDDVLILRVAGSVPTACHLVSIERGLADVEPPSFVVRMAIDPRARCRLETAPYEVTRAFRIGIPRESVVVYHAPGRLDVDVDVLGVDLEESAEESPQPSRAAAAAPGSRLASIFDEDRPPAEAVGYSRAYDLGAAVRDAIAKIPPRGAGIPDWLNSYDVVSIGAEVGGIAGFNHLRVVVRG